MTRPTEPIRRLSRLSLCCRAATALLLLLSLAAKTATANSLRILDDPLEALQSRIDLIQRAERTIDLAYYAIDNDEVPIALLELLRQASGRGVRVRILVDGLKSRLPAAFEQYMRQNGLQIRVYHRPHTGNPRWLNRRLHAKMIVVDSTWTIIGSRNLENEFYGFEDCGNYVDCDALVNGELADHAQHYFDWLWNSPDVQLRGIESLGLDVLNYRPLGQSVWSRTWRRARTNIDYQQLLNRAVQRVVCRLDVDLHSSRDWLEDSIHGVELDLLHDLRTDKCNRHVQTTIVRMLDCAQCSILIESPYPAFDSAIRSALARARGRGVCVTILTNSLETTDQPNVYAAYQNQKRSLLREGVHLREFWGEETLHAKSMIVDDSTWMLGSYNFDSRSDRLNMELCIISDDPDGASSLRCSIRSRLARSTPIQPKGLLLDVGRNPAFEKWPALMLRRTYVELFRSSL